MIVPDSYRYPIPALGWVRQRYSALDVAEAQTGRRLSREGAHRLELREAAAVRHTRETQAFSRRLGELLG